MYKQYLNLLKHHVDCQTKCIRQKCLITAQFFKQKCCCQVYLQLGLYTVRGATCCLRYVVSTSHDVFELLSKYTSAASSHLQCLTTLLQWFMYIAFDAAIKKKKKPRNLCQYICQDELVCIRVSDTGLCSTSSPHPYCYGISYNYIRYIFIKNVQIE